VSLEGRGVLWKKRKEQVERIENFGKGRALGALVFSIIQNTPNLGELNNYTGGGF